MSTALLRIGGMHCASCVGRVEKALRGVVGVNEASVNLATGEARVSFDRDAQRRRRDRRHRRLLRGSAELPTGCRLLPTLTRCDTSTMRRNEHSFRRLEALTAVVGLC